LTDQKELQGENAPMQENDKTQKELRQIRNLLILVAMKLDATSDEVHYATGMGAANIRALFPIKRGRRSAKKASN
jgi:hypothetical protein